MSATVDARGFLKAVVWAGLYDEAGKRIPFNQDKANLDLRYALAGYCGLEIGYKDSKGKVHPAPTLASQVEMAKLHARAELDTIIGFEAAAREACDRSEVAKAKALQALEVARLLTIRKELEQF